MTWFLVWWGHPRFSLWWRRAAPLGCSAALCGSGNVITMHLLSWKKNTRWEFLKGVEGRMTAPTDVSAGKFYLPNHAINHPLLLLQTAHDDALYAEIIVPCTFWHGCMYICIISKMTGFANRYGAKCSWSSTPALLPPVHILVLPPPPSAYIYSINGRQ